MKFFEIFQKNEEFTKTINNKRKNDNYSGNRRIPLLQLGLQ